jgi:hypothetical protein
MTNDSNGDPVVNAYNKNVKRFYLQGTKMNIVLFLIECTKGGRMEEDSEG